jgi:hypothetical protein
VRWIPADPHGYFDSVLELIDVASGRVVANVRVDEHLDALAAPDMAASSAEGSGGVPYVRLWHVTWPEAAPVAARGGRQRRR